MRTATVLRLEITPVVAVVEDGKTAGLLTLAPMFHYPANPLDLASLVEQIEASAPADKLAEAQESARSLRG